MCNSDRSKLWYMELISVGQMHASSCNDSGQLKPTWLGKAPEKMQLHHLSLLQACEIAFRGLKEVQHQYEVETWERKMGQKRLASHCNVVQSLWKTAVFWYKAVQELLLFQAQICPIWTEYEYYHAICDSFCASAFVILFWLACAISLYLSLYMCPFFYILWFSFRFSDC